MATVPPLKDTGAIERAEIDTANTNTDGTGTMVEVVEGAAKGTVIDRVQAIATGAVADGAIRIFHDNGTDKKFLGEIGVTTTGAPSATQRAWQGAWVPPSEFILPSTHKLFAATHLGEEFIVYALGGAV